MVTIEKVTEIIDNRTENNWKTFFQDILLTLRAGAYEFIKVFAFVMTVLMLSILSQSMPILGGSLLGLVLLVYFAYLFYTTFQMFYTKFKSMGL